MAGKLTLLSISVLLIMGGFALADAQKVQRGPGDVRDGYGQADYQTDSASLQARQGHQADLLAVLDKPLLGLPPIAIPDNNPVTADKVQLGRKLFFDRRLSINNTVSCAMCHIAEQGFAQNEGAFRGACGVRGGKLLAISC